MTSSSDKDALLDEKYVSVFGSNNFPSAVFSSVFLVSITVPTLFLAKAKMAVVSLAPIVEVETHPQVVSIEG